MDAPAEIEAIRQLKYRYQRYLDTKRYDDIEGLFLPEATSSYGNGRYAQPDRKSTVEFLRLNADPNKFLLHQTHNPEITLLSPTEAKGLWYFEETVFYIAERKMSIGAGFYRDRYKKVDGEWKILHTGYRRTFCIISEMKDIISIENGFDEGPFDD
jgi:bile-acid 7alpha-dehydratase